MATERMDVCSPRTRKDRDGNPKTYWTKVGTAWKTDKGISITFDALPLTDEKGECRVSLFEPRPKEGDVKPPTGNAPRPAIPRGDDMNDEIPFAPEYR